MSDIVGEQSNGCWLQGHRLNTALFWLNVKVKKAQIVIMCTLPWAVLLYFIAKSVVGL